MKSERAINAEYTCKYCTLIVANGVGPSGLPMVTTVLNKLPSSHVFYRCACQHDVDYHEQIGKVLADTCFLISMKNEAWLMYPVIERDHWYSWLNPKRILSTLDTASDFAKRRALIAFAYRNYYFVKWFGDQAYKDGACKTFGKK